MRTWGSSEFSMDPSGLTAAKESGDAAYFFEISINSDKKNMIWGAKFVEIVSKSCEKIIFFANIFFNILGGVSHGVATLTSAADRLKVIIPPSAIFQIRMKETCKFGAPFGNLHAILPKFGVEFGNFK